MQVKYRPDIDGLRTIAVMSVIIYHAEFALYNRTLFAGGYLGVDVFFVLSGFLITSLLVSELEDTNRVSIVNFYARRTRRLLPALFFVMLASIPAAWLILYPSQLVDFSKSLITTLLFSSNVYWWDKLGEYGTEASNLKPFLHTWSLAVEEQFYIFYPLLLVVLHKWWRKHTIVILMLLLFGSIQLAEWVTSAYPSFSFYLIPTRFWELAAGGLLVYFLREHPPEKSSKFLLQTMPALGMCLVLYSVCFMSYGPGHPGFVTAIPVLGTVFLIWFANQNDLITLVLSSKPFVAVGKISYSLYLWHFPVFAFARNAVPKMSVLLKLELIALTFAFSILSYYVIEKPFRYKRVKLSGVVVALGLALVVTGSFISYSLLNNGVRERFGNLVSLYGKNEFDNKILEQKSWTILNDIAMNKGFQVSQAHVTSRYEYSQLWFNPNSDAKKILVVGNSHGNDTFSALYQNRNLFTDKQFARFGMASNCPEKQMSLLVSSPNFKAANLVLISFRYTLPLEDIERLIATVKAYNKEIVLCLNTAEFHNIEGKPVFDWYVQNTKKFSETELEKLMFRNRALERDILNNRLRAIAASFHVPTLDKTKLLCDFEGEFCDAVTNDGYKIFYDFAHLTQEGAKYFGKKIYNQKLLDNVHN